jgi:hypothetical protein
VTHHFRRTPNRTEYGVKKQIEEKFYLWKKWDDGRSCSEVTSTALHKAAHIKELESGAGRYFPAQLLGRRVLLPSLLLYSASSGAGKVASELALPPSAFCGD